MMHTSVSKFARNDKGATAVEFAIILLVLLLVVFGIIEWGLYMYNRQVITNAVREGARHGVLMRPIPRDVQAENDAICNRVVDKGSSYLVTFGADELTCDENVTDGDYGDIKIVRDPNVLVFGTDLTVSVEYEYDFLFLRLHPINIDSIDIETQATMKME
jgi:Flp pilus assembly protein TadG